MSRPSAFATDVRRTITGNLKRFISIFIICALGAAMLVGLKAACDDLRLTADSYYDDQNLFDISVQSTLGLTQGDIDALANLDDVDAAEGSYTETAYTQVDGSSEKVDLKALSAQGLNQPQVVEGELPRAADEVAVTTKYADAAGKGVGDTLTFFSKGERSSSTSTAAGSGDAADSGDTAAADEESGEIFKRGTYTITAVVRDAMDVNSDTSTMGFRTASSTKYAFFLTRDAVEDPNVFTIAYLSVAGARELPSYSAAYEDLIAKVKDEAEQIREDREDARTSAVKDEAMDKVDKAEREAREKLDDAADKIGEAQRTLNGGWDQLAAGKDEYSLQEKLALSQLDSAKKQIEQGYAQLASAKAELDSSEKTVADGLAQLAAGEAQLDDAQAQANVQIAAARAELESKQADLQHQKQRIDDAAAQIKAMLEQMGAAAYWPEDLWNTVCTQVDEEQSAAAVEKLVQMINTQMQAYGEQSTAQLKSAIEQLNQQLEGPLAQIDQLEGQIEQLDPQRPDYEQTKAQLEAARDAIAEQIAPARLQLSELQTQYDQALIQIEEQTKTYVGLVQGRAAVTLAEPRIAGGFVELDQQQSYADSQFAAQREQLAATRSQLEAASAQIAAGRAQIEASRRKLDSSAATFETERTSALQKLQDARAVLESSELELKDGQAELDASRDEYNEQRADAEREIDDAREEVRDMEGAVWYIQDRGALPSYASVDSDASSIEAIATVFPVIFFTVAVLISLTTVTRMVEEDRGLIGLYKALGYSRARIQSKYLIYSATACIAGGIAGDALGFLALPAIIFTIFKTMYALPPFQFHFDLGSALLGVALFAVGIVGATFVACRQVLKETPASLMRPKAPRAGARILLERITPIWKRLGFLNKVTARNLFRYKKRFFMTVFGIAGCTALLICGLGIRDTVISLKPRQYGEAGVVRYDLMAVTADDDYAAARDELLDADEVDELLGLRIDSVTAEFGGVRESVQIMVVPDGTDLSSYLKMESLDGRALTVPAGSALITKNAEQVLGFALGDSVTLQDSSLRQGEVRIEDIVLNYLGNFVFMDQSTYRDAFGQDAAPNAFLALLNGDDGAQIAFADELAADDLFMTVSSTARIANDFSESFKIIDVVVYVVTVMAAALAFAVVFTLSTTNISERERELATIKVLGFRRREVYRYINKETVILTLVGIVAGFPLGYAITRALTVILRMPSLYFDTLVELPTYAIAAAMSLLFTLIINAITNRSLDRVDMVGALKSAE